MRRRLAWTGVFMLVAGLVAGLIVAFPNPPPPKAAEMTTIEGDVVPVEKPVRFGPRRDEVLLVARKFVATAVARRHVEDSWDLVAPSLKQGYTKKTWAKGEIPVTPFPFYVGRWRVSYSFKNEIDLRVALFPPPQKKLNPIVFDVTLNRFGRKGHDRWLVSSFVPVPSAYGEFPSRSTRTNPFGIGTQDPIPQPRRSSRVWLLFPVGLIGVLLIVLGTLGVKHWQGTRVYRAHVRERQMSSSRPS
jgi:hypothetical protein